MYRTPSLFCSLVLSTSQADGLNWKQKVPGGGEGADPLSAESTSLASTERFTVVEGTFTRYCSEHSSSTARIPRQHWMLLKFDFYALLALGVS